MRAWGARVRAVRSFQISATPLPHSPTLLRQSSVTLTAALHSQFRDDRETEHSMNTHRIGRREALTTLIGAAGAAAAYGCSSSVTSPTTTSSTTSNPTSTNAQCAVTPGET